MNATYLTVIIPCFNEKSTIKEIINKIKQLKKLKIQIILIDDCSTDGTRTLIKRHIEDKVDKIIFHRKNKGKGAAIISAIKFIKGDFVIIQDADLEYDPRDYYKLLEPLIKKKAKIVYGSRVLGRKKTVNFLDLRDSKKNFRIMGNFFLTLFSNLINNQSLTDVHTCYKVFEKNFFLSLNLQESGFSFCPEVTTKISHSLHRIIEIPISYDGREVKDGKKIGIKDAFSAILTIIKYRYFYKYK